MRPDIATGKPQRQRRLTHSEIDDLVDLYATGIDVRQLAAALGINRDTALRHLRRRGVPSRASVRQLTVELLEAAAHRYLAGEPMAMLCDEFGINLATLRRELANAGVPFCRPGRLSTRRFASERDVRVPGA